MRGADREMDGKVSGRDEGMSLNISERMEAERWDLEESGGR